MIGRIIGLIIVGLVVGALGRLVHPGRDPMPIWVTALIGVSAALLAGLIVGGLLGFVLAVLIAAVLIAIIVSTYPGRAV
jgi:uncharacterized membrane protein YeaQ/YmgE (transglycosylase-associated protein family)